MGSHAGVVTLDHSVILIMQNEHRTNYMLHTENDFGAQWNFCGAEAAVNKLMYELIVLLCTAGSFVLDFTFVYSK